MRGDGHGMTICTYADKTSQLQSKFKFKQNTFFLLYSWVRNGHIPRSFRFVPRKISGASRLSGRAHSFVSSCCCSLILFCFLNLGHGPCSGCGRYPIIRRAIRLRTCGLWFWFCLCSFIFFLAGADLVGDAEFGGSRRSGHYAAMLGSLFRSFRTDWEV